MKRYMAMALSILLVLALAACGGSGSSPDSSSPAAPADAPSSAAPASGGNGEVIEIKYGGTVPDAHQFTQGAYMFKALLEERSEGRVVVNVYPNNQIGAPRDLAEGVQMNTIQMCDNSIAAVSGFTDAFMPLTMPFLFPSREIAYEFIDGPMGQELTERVAAETGIRVAGWGENGIRQLANSKRPIRTPEDMAGLKIRVMESPVYIKMFESLGASPTPMSFAELFTALQQKTIDGQDNPYSVTASNKLYEVQSYMTDLSHTFDYGLFLVSEEFYQGLPEDIRQLFDECLKEALDFTRELVVKEDEEHIQTISQTVEMTFLTPEERQAFAEKCEPVYDWFREEYPAEADNLDRYIAEIARLNS